MAKNKPVKNCIYLFAFLGLLAFSCSDDPDPVTACNLDNVLELPWLAERIEEIESSEFGRNYSSISMGTYNSQTVFISGNCCPNCNSVITVSDCSGNFLGIIGQDDISADEITDRKVIWKSADNSCGM